MSKLHVSFDATQLGSQMHVAVRVGGLKVTTFEISATDFEHLIDALDRKPVVTVTLGEPEGGSGRGRREGAKDQ